MSRQWLNYASKPAHGTRITQQSIAFAVGCWSSWIMVVYLTTYVFQIGDSTLGFDMMFIFGIAAGLGVTLWATIAFMMVSYIVGIQMNRRLPERVWPNVALGGAYAIISLCVRLSRLFFDIDWLPRVGTLSFVFLPVVGGCLLAFLRGPSGRD